MRSNYIQFRTPQFRILSDSQIEELHYATLQILARTGVTVECEEAIDLLGEAGADVSNPKRVKIPANIVEQAIRTTPKSFTLYTRDGEPAIALNGMKESHFGAISDYDEYLDPYTRKRRPCYVEDIADMARVCDALPNIEWMYPVGAFQTLPGALAEREAVLQTILNCTKPIFYNVTSLSSLKDALEICSLVAGGEKELAAKPFVVGTCGAITPLVLGKGGALDKGLLCAEKGIPMCIGGGQLAGATAPATLPGAIAISNAESLSQIVIIQLKKPGAPVIFGGHTTIMDMKTTIFSYGAPEMSLAIAALTELSRYYKLPMFGTAGCTDAEVIDAQAGAEIACQVLMSALSGADLPHDAGLMYHSMMASPELLVFVDEIIDMVKILMGGLEINDETLPLDLIDQVGPGGDYVSQSHTLKHFRKFWVPTIFDRSLAKGKDSKNCEELLNEKTIKILETHKPKPLSEYLIRELKKIEGTWFAQAGLKHEYPKRK